MKTQFTPDFNRAEWILYNYLREQGFKLRVGQVKDFRLDADTPESEVIGYAQDFISDFCDDSDTDYTPQDRYNDENAFAIRQSERYESFMAER